MQTSISESLYFKCLNRYLDLLVDGIGKDMPDALQLRLFAIYCWNAGHSLGDQI